MIITLLFVVNSIGLFIDGVLETESIYSLNHEAVSLLGVQLNKIHSDKINSQMRGVTGSGRLGGVVSRKSDKNVGGNHSLPL